jgi:predicted Zn-dependent protease
VTRVVVAIGLLSAGPAAAGEYHPAEPCPFPVKPDGTVEELGFGPQFDGPFPTLFTARLNAADTRPERADNPDRKAILARLAAGTDPAAKAVDLIRLTRADEAVNLLVPLSRGRSPDFRVLMNLAHAYARRGDWGDAIPVHSLAAEEAVPADLPGTTPDQRKWLTRVERQFYSKWLVINRDRAAKRYAAETEGVFPLFPVNWVNDAGVYEPGRLADAERAKLPADAVPVVQQLLLWAPGDTGLYWLLAELYAATGRLRQAEVIIRQCVEGRQFSNRAVLMAHRKAVMAAVAELPADTSSDPVLVPDAPPAANGGDFLPSEGRLIAVGAGFGVLAAVLIGLQVRAVWKRVARNG